MIIAIAGSGGKTTLLKNLAKQYQEQGKTVLVTTTTHMFVEPDTLLTDDASVILKVLAEKGYVMAGKPAGIKIEALSRESFDAVCAAADVVLVEADGSKHMPIKYPNGTEPVIPAGTDQIIVVWGPHGLQKPAREVCHRLELVQQCLGIGEDTLITREHVRQLLQEGYLIPLKKQFPYAEITVHPEL